MADVALQETGSAKKRYYLADEVDATIKENEKERRALESKIVADQVSGSPSLPWGLYPNTRGAPERLAALRHHQT